MKFGAEVNWQEGNKWKGLRARLLRVRWQWKGRQNHTESRTHLLGPHERTTAHKYTPTEVLCKNTHSAHPIPERGCRYSLDEVAHKHRFSNTQCGLQWPVEPLSQGHGVSLNVAYRALGSMAEVGEMGRNMASISVDEWKDKKSDMGLTNTEHWPLHETLRQETIQAQTQTDGERTAS